MPDTPIAAPPEIGTRPAFDNAYARLPERFYAAVAPTTTVEGSRRGSGALSFDTRFHPCSRQRSA